MSAAPATARPLVLHLAVDYPNVYRPENTAAVRNFVKACDTLDHRVVALTRTANPFAVSQADGDGKGDPNVLSMRYWGLPFGFLLALSMYIVSWRVAREARRRQWQPQAIHAHKLTFEGLAGWFLARRWGLPLIVSVRGEAESKILRFKPHYRPLLQRLLNDAKRVYYVSAWFKPILNRRFRISEDRQSLLPNFVTVHDRQAHRPQPRAGHLVTVMDLNVYRKKGLDRLLPAFRECLKTHPDARLDVIGRGEPAVVSEVQQLIARLGLQDRVSLLGPLPNAELLDRLPGYAGMALPSHNETFGMIYVEALLAGVPILYSRGTGIDGFLTCLKGGIGVDPLDAQSIHAGLESLIEFYAGNSYCPVSEKIELLKIFGRDSYLIDYRALFDIGGAK